MPTTKSLVALVLLGFGVIFPILLVTAWLSILRSDVKLNLHLLDDKTGRERFLQSANITLRADIETAEQAKRAQLFWPAFELAVSPPDQIDRRGFGIQIGAGVDVLNHPTLAAEVFPGYLAHHPDFLSNSELWNRYFASPFNSKIWLPSLSKSPFGHHALYVPWKGCLEIWNSYGADILLVGTSEAYRSLVPALLSESSPSPWRALSCATGGLRPREQEWLIGKLKDASKPRAKRVIWGLSYWTLRPKALLEERRPELFQTETADWQVKGIHNFSFPLRFPRWSEVKKYLQDSDRTNWLAEEMKYWTQDGSLIFKKGTLHTVDTQREIESLRQTRAEASQHHSCELAAESKAYVERMLRNLKEVADEVVVFLPPVLPLFKADEPECFHRSLKAWLSSQRGSQIHLILPTEQMFPADDFLYPTWSEDLSYLNSNHLNYEGASKFTHLLNQKFPLQP